MGFNDINLQVSGPQQPASIYKTKVLKGQVPFAIQVTEPNTKYVIKHNFVLDDDITIPDGCVLQFDGGSISGEHTITGQNTGIEAGLVKIFNTDVIFAGTWNVAEAYPEWFGAKGDGVIDDYIALNKCIYSGLSCKVLFSKMYRITQTLYYSKTNTGDVTYNIPLTIEGIDKNSCGLFLDNENLNGEVISIRYNPITIRNIRVKGAKYTTSYSEFEQYVSCIGISISNVNYPVLIENCIVHNLRSNGINTIGCNATVKILNNIVYDCYFEYILCSVHQSSAVITGNILGTENNRAEFGIDSNTKNSIITNNVVKYCITGITYENTNTDPDNNTYVSNSYNAVIANNVLYKITNSNVNISGHGNYAERVLVANNTMIPEKDFTHSGNCCGITLGRVKDSVIENNLIISGVRDSKIQGTCMGVKFTALCNNITIKGNTIRNFQRFGVSLFDQGHTHDGNLIEDIFISENIFDSIEAAAIQARDDYKNVYITNNIFKNCVGVSVIEEPIDDFIVENNIPTNPTKLALDFVLQTSKNNKENPTAVKSIGSSLERPTNNIFLGFPYFDNTLGKVIFRGDGKWLAEDGSNADAPISGTFANKPAGSDIPVGYAYRCTDKFAPEPGYNTTNGLVIFYGGNNTWYDACGRIVDANYPARYMGEYANKPSPAASFYKGLIYIDITNSRPLIWSGYVWKDMEGVSVSVKKVGTWSERPTVATDIYEGFCYTIKDTNIFLPVYAKISSGTITWYKADGTQYTE